MIKKTKCFIVLNVMKHTHSLYTEPVNAFYLCINRKRAAMTKTNYRCLVIGTGLWRALSIALALTLDHAR